MSNVKTVTEQVKLSKGGVMYTKLENIPEAGITIKNGDILYFKSVEEFFNGLAEAGVLTEEKAKARIANTPDFVKRYLQVPKAIIERGNK